MSWIGDLVSGLGLTQNLGPTKATLDQVKNAPVGTQSLYEQRARPVTDELEQAFKPLVRGWQPGQAPLTQEQYDRIQSASLDLFDKLGMTSPMGAQPSRVMAASMRKAVRPPPKTYAEAKTPAAQEVEFQHASPHKFTNIDADNPFGKFDESHLLKGEGATVYGPGAAYVSTAEPTHRHYMKQFKEKTPNRVEYDIAKLETDFGPVPNFLKLKGKTISGEDLKSWLEFYSRATVSENLPPKIKAAVEEENRKTLPWLQKFIASGASIEKYKLPSGPYSYRGTIAEDPARTVLYDKPLHEQLPEVQAALARASSRVRKTLGETPAVELVHPTNPWATDVVRFDLEQYFLNRFLSQGNNKKLLDQVERVYNDSNITYVSWPELPAKQKLKYMAELYSPDAPAGKAALRQAAQIDQFVDRYTHNPKLASKLPGLDENLKRLLAEVEIRSATKENSIFAEQGAGEYIKGYRANAKTVQRLRDAGIDLIKYGGSSESPNYVVVNPAAAKIRQRTPSIAATFGTGELARQLYESIYGKEVQ